MFVRQRLACGTNGKRATIVRSVADGKLRVYLRGADRHILTDGQLFTLLPHTNNKLDNVSKGDRSFIMHSARTARIRRTESNSHAASLNPPCTGGDRPCARAPREVSHQPALLSLPWCDRAMQSQRERERFLASSKRAAELARRLHGFLFRSPPELPFHKKSPIQKNVSSPGYGIFRVGPRLLRPVLT